MNEALPRSRRHIWVAIVCTIAVVVAIAAMEGSRRGAPVATPAAPAPATISAAPPVARVVDAARALKLVTWTFDTHVDAQSISDRWYGDAVATVRAPVRYQYGVDLEGLERQDVLFDEAGGRYVFIVPAPRRIAVEVDMQQLEQTLKTSGMRWRSANQDQLNEARTILAAKAQQMVLSSDDERRLRDVSREQIIGLLRTVLGAETLAGSTIDVRFAD